MAKPASFVKGDPRINRKGRPKEAWTMRGLIIEALEEEDETGTPHKKSIARKLANLAKSGDIVAIKEVNNRIDGMPQQKTDITSGGKPIPLLTNLNVSNNDSNEEIIES